MTNHYTTNADRLNRSESINARGRTSRSWTSGGCRVSVMTREDAGVDCDEPWIASCNTHGEMIGCETKRAAESAARHRDWCSGCSNPSRFQQMFADLPVCMAGALNGDERTEFDLIHLVRIEIDLIEEGEDGTDPADLGPLRRWLKRWRIN